LGAHHPLDAVIKLGIRHQERKKDKVKDKVCNGPGQLLGFYVMNGSPSFFGKNGVVFQMGSSFSRLFMWTPAKKEKKEKNEEKKEKNESINLSLSL